MTNKDGRSVIGALLILIVLGIVLIATATAL